MQRARRLVSAFVVASVAMAGMSACSFQPDVAARLGADKTITEKDVQKIWDESYETLLDKAAAPATAASAGPSAAAEPVRVPYTRGELVRAIVSRDLYGRLAAAKNVSLPAEVPYDEAGAQLGLPATDAFVRLYVESLYLENVLTKAAATSPVTPTEEDLRIVFDRMSANGGLGGADFATFGTKLTAEDKSVLGAALAVRNDVVALAGKLGVEVSPRYQPLELGLLGSTNQATGKTYSVVGAALGADSAVPVADLP